MTILNVGATEGMLDTQKQGTDNTKDYFGVINRRVHRVFGPRCAVVCLYLKQSNKNFLFVLSLVTESTESEPVPASRIPCSTPYISELHVSVPHLQHSRSVLPFFEA